MLVEDDECVVVYVKLGGIEEKNTKDKDDSQFCEIIHISSPLRKKRKFSLIVSSSDEESDDSDVSIDVENSEESDLGWFRWLGQFGRLGLLRFGRKQ